MCYRLYGQKQIIYSLKTFTTMKVNLKITELNHDDLVDLFATAFTGNPNWIIDYNPLDEKFEEDDCVEDIIAKVLLNGGYFIVYDTNSSDKNDSYGKLPKVWDDEDEMVGYEIRLKDIKRGIERAFNGTYKVYKNDVEFVRNAVTSILNRDGNIDMYGADAIMQVIMFNEIIFG